MLALSGLMFFASINFVLPKTPLLKNSVEYVPFASSQLAGENGLLAARTNPGDHKDYIDEWNDTYDVVFTTEVPYSGNAQYTWSVATNKTHDAEYAYYEQFDYELSKYSPDFLSEAGIHQIIFVDNLNMIDGTPVLGFADILSGVIYFDIEATRANTGLIQSTIHHEIAHIMLYEAYGMDMYSLESWPSKRDEGFVSEYAKTSVAEDMAEVFAHAMTDQYQTALRQEAKNDSILQEKLELVRQGATLVDADFILPI